MRARVSRVIRNEASGATCNEFRDGFGFAVSSLRTAHPFCGRLPRGDTVRASSARLATGERA